MYTPLIIKVDIPGGMTRSPSPDAGVEVQPLPGPAPTRDECQDVDVDVVDAARGDDLGGLGPVLTVSPGRNQ